MDAIPSEKQLALYRPAFVHNCMILVVRAHRSLIPSAFQHAEEPDITGELVRAAHDIIESNDTEPWMDHLEVLDDPPQNVSGRFSDSSLKGTRSQARVPSDDFVSQHLRSPRL